MKDYFGGEMFETYAEWGFSKVHEKYVLEKSMHRFQKIITK